MVIALIIAAASIVGGSLLALLPTRRSQILGPIRTFGLTASAAVVVLHLLPEVYEARGAFGLLAFLAALLAPSAIGPLMRVATRSRSENNDSRNDKSAEWVTLRITYVSLLVHSVADGIALSAYSGHMHQGRPHYDVLVALSAHTVPVAAVMTLTFRDFRGVRWALFGALGLWVATSVGVIGAGLVPHEAVHGASAWVGAVVAGLLLHVVTHDLGGHAPARWLERVVDLVAAAAGIGVGLLSGDAHSHLTEARGMAPSLGRALVEVTLQTAPLLVLGLCLGAFVQTFQSRLTSAWFGARGVLSAAIRGALVGLWLPLAACHLHAVAKELEARRAPVGFVVAFLLATPALGLETLALTLGFWGSELALWRLVAALAIAACTACLVGLLARPAAASASHSGSIELPLDSVASAPRRFLAAFEALFRESGAWMVLGIVAAAFVEALVPSPSAGSAESPLVELGIVTLLTVPSFICAPSAIPLGAVLIAKGVSPGAVLVGLLLGPAINLRILGLLKSAYGTRASVITIVATIALSWAMAFGLSRAAFPVPNREIAPAWLGISAAALLVLLWFRSLWRNGTRAWFASVLHPSSEKPHAHGHSPELGSALLEQGSALR